MYAVDVAKPSATYRLDGDLLAKVRVLAAECGETVTDAVDWGLRAYIRSKERGQIVSAAPVSVATVHTASEWPAGDVEALEDEPERSPCRHPAGLVSETGVCGECGEDVW